MRSRLSNLALLICLCMALPGVNGAGFVEAVSAETTSAETSSASPRDRLQAARPDSGRFVKTNLGYMVPYSQRLPGTDLSIEMLPVSGGTRTLPPLPPVENAPAAKTGKPRETEASFGPYWIGKYEITMPQYMPYRRLYYQQRKADAKALNRRPVSQDDLDAVTGPTEVYDTSFNFEYAEDDHSPAPSASQFATRQYTKWLSLTTGTEYRLPLRSEWQNACLAGSNNRYGFQGGADELGTHAVYLDNVPEDPLTLRVGSKRANAWGLHDMLGNVAEFVIEDTARYGLRYGHVACGGHSFSPADQCTAISVMRTTEDWWDQDPDLPRSCWWMTSDDARMTGFRIVAPLEPMSPQTKKLAWSADSPDLTVDIQDRIEGGRGSIGIVKPPAPKTRRVPITKP